MNDVFSLSLISHTNVGKTTLARTLLRKDVGEILDQAHVTDSSERYLLLSASSGRIVLWDTPGFGDSARLFRELDGREDPLEWLDSQSYDPHAERALFSSRAAVLNVRDEADAILYLVNASEDPAMAGYVEPEMRILAWLDRPVVVLLNQTGNPEDADARRRDEERWRWHLASFAAVADVISLDAFSRCWVQEGLLLLRLEALVRPEAQAMMSELLARWSADNLSILSESAEALARPLWEAANDSEPVGDALLSSIARKRAVETLSSRMDRKIKRALDHLIEIHGLEGEAASWARGAFADVKVPGDKPDPRKVSVLGGIAGGALGGLLADVAHGGLTLGGGTIAGALLGGLGLGSLAWAYEQIGDRKDPVVVWSTELLDRLVRDALLRYLAVAHFGRGAGAFRERVTPMFWAPRVEAVLEGERRAFSRIWKKARRGDGDPQASGELTELLGQVMRSLLKELFPGCGRLFTN